MLPDWVSNPGPLTYESGALPIALRGPGPPQGSLEPKIGKIYILIPSVFVTDDKGNLLASEIFHLPSRKKHPLYYTMIENLIDLKMIEKKIFSAEYQNIESFEKDVVQLFQNVEVIVVEVRTEQGCHGSWKNI